jgi:amino acid adenylation domain-containing protein
MGATPNGLAYWRERLADFDGPTRLGRQLRRGSLATHTHRVDFAVTGPGYGQLTSLAKGEPGQVYAIALTALAICLHRHTGHTRVVIGCPARAGVPQATAVPITVDLAVPRSFRALCTVVAKDLDTAAAHQVFPLTQLLEELGLFPAPGENALFEVVCHLSGYHGPEVPAAPVALALTSVPHGLLGLLTFAADVLDEQEARWFRDHLAHVLAGAVAHPDAAVDSLGALPPALYDTFVHGWNPAATPGPAEPLPHRRFEAQARRQPDAIAIGGAVTVTYAELDAAANRLAGYLVVEAAVRPGDIVAIALERSVEMIVAVLAVLKAGAAYLPLEVSHPAARLRFMLTDARAALILTASRHRDRLPATTRLLCLDELTDVDGDRVATAPHAPVWPESLLCVIYTSGTTGRPKGVMLTHQAIANSLSWEELTFALTPADRLLHMASFAFSLAIVEVLSPLCAGAQVVLAPAEATRDSAWISRLVTDHEITILSVVPSELKLLLEQEPTMPWTALRRVVTGADVLPQQVHDLYFATCPSVPLLNIYGQTESAVDGTCWTCRPVPGQTTVPIGGPIANTQVYLLDSGLRPVPVGTPGELYMGGEGLARGYLGRPELTAEKFVPDPFSAAPGRRLYRSGDVARRLPDGSLELIGRNDHQVQIRGIRVELEEIEAVLRAHPSVRDAVVATHTLPERRDAEVPADAEGWTRLLAGVDRETVERLLAEAGA